MSFDLDAFACVMDFVSDAAYKKSRRSLRRSCVFAEDSLRLCNLSVDEILKDSSSCWYLPSSGVVGGGVVWVGEVPRSSLSRSNTNCH